MKCEKRFALPVFYAGEIQTLWLSEEQLYKLRVPTEGLAPLVPRGDYGEPIDERGT